MYDTQIFTSDDPRVSEFWICGSKWHTIISIKEYWKEIGSSTTPHQLGSFSNDDGDSREDAL